MVTDVHQFAVLDDRFYPSNILDIFEGVLANHNQVGQFTGFQGSKLFVLAQESSIVAGSYGDRLHRAEPRIHQKYQLALQAQTWNTHECIGARKQHAAAPVEVRDYALDIRVPLSNLSEVIRFLQLIKY